MAPELVSTLSNRQKLLSLFPEIGDKISNVKKKASFGLKNNITNIALSGAGAALGNVSPLLSSLFVKVLSTRKEAESRVLSVLEKSKKDSKLAELIKEKVGSGPDSIPKLFEIYRTLEKEKSVLGDSYKESQNFKNFGEIFSNKYEKESNTPEYRTTSFSDFNKIESNQNDSNSSILESIEKNTRDTATALGVISSTPSSTNEKNTQVYTADKTSESLRKINETIKSTSDISSITNSETKSINNQQPLLLKESRPKSTVEKILSLNNQIRIPDNTKNFFNNITNKSSSTPSKLLLSLIDRVKYNTSTKKSKENYTFENKADDKEEDIEKTKIQIKESDQTQSLLSQILEAIKNNQNNTINQTQEPGNQASGNMLDSLPDFFGGKGKRIPPISGKRPSTLSKIKSLGSRVGTTLGSIKSSAGSKILSGASSIGKIVGKNALKILPGVGLISGLGFAADRFSKGDYLGAAGEAVGGVVSTIPGPGTIAAGAINAGLAARDITNEFKDIDSVGKIDKTDILNTKEVNNTVLSENKEKLIQGLPSITPQTPIDSVEKIYEPMVKMQPSQSVGFKIPDIINGTNTLEKNIIPVNSTETISGMVERQSTEKILSEIKDSKTNQQPIIIDNSKNVSGGSNIQSPVTVTSPTVRNNDSSFEKIQYRDFWYRPQ